MKNILVAVTGNTPQIVTEILYFYTQIEKLPIAEIHILTTSRGAEIVEKELFANGRGAFFKFCTEYGLRSSEIERRSVHILQNERGENLSDIRTVADNSSAANQIFSFIKNKCDETNTRLFCSLAGGRKTMSAYMALAMQFFARPHDRLSHVLIQPEELENSRQFFYPPADETEIDVIDKEGKKLSIPVKNIRIDLAEIHFVRLREKLANLFHTVNITYEEMVHLSQGTIDQLIEPPKMTYHIRNRTLVIHSSGQTFTFRLPHKMATVYHYLLLPGNKNRLLNSRRELIQLYTTHYKVGVEIWDGMFKSKDLMQLVASINKRFREKISSAAVLQFCKISNPRKEGKTWHKIALTDYPGQIKICD